MTVDFEDPGETRSVTELAARLRIAVGPGRDVHGWATVDLDRAEATLSGERRPPRRSTAVVDVVLGASGRSILLADGREVVLLEPSTEGRMAAALARHGEGRLVTYVLARPGAPSRARAAGIGLSAERRGPFGPQRLVLGGSRWGPFLVLVAGD
ncbi:MAG: hypothetical protein HYX54_06325 [Chloroflexi bacterium]|nr:hypothetical protein [Chloroflexota bacterium]